MRWPRACARASPWPSWPRRLSDDAHSRARGGDLGWQRKGGTTLGSEVEDKVWAAKDGELVGPVKIAGGLALVVPEATREGDISFEQARLEIAESELRQERSQARAKAEAEAAVAKAKAEPSKSLKDLFPAPENDEKAGKSNTLHAEETGLYSRRGSMVQGIGPAPSVAKAAFELTGEAPLGGPFQGTGQLHRSQAQGSPETRHGRVREGKAADGRRRRPAERARRW